MELETENIFLRRESNVRSYCRSFPVVFKKASGAHVWDEEGTRYIDFFAGAGALNYGHNNEEIRDALIDYLMRGEITHSLDLYTCAKRDFLNSFERVILKPKNLPHKVMFSGPTGTNSVEAAMKIARLATGRERIAAFTNGFHGMSMGSLSATGNKYNRQGAGGGLIQVDRYQFDGYHGNNIDTIDLIQKLIEDPSSGYEAPAAFLLETVQAEGGLNVARPEWLRKLSQLAKKHGSVIIVDDVQVGCGRTGSFFSFEEAGITPDIICLSKSISGFGLPMALVLVLPEYDVFLPGQHNGTFRGNNLAFVAARHALEFWGQSNFVEGVQRNIEIVTESLQHIQELLGKDFSIRGRGMIQGIVCPSGEIASAIAKACFARGLIIETCGAHDQVVKLLPPLNIAPEILSEGLSILAECALSVLVTASDDTSSLDLQEAEMV